MRLLLSDGQSSAGIAPSEAAAQAAGAQVHTVGIGQRGAAPMLGGGQRAELDEATLLAIARQTGGQYFYAAQAGQLEQIYGDLSSQVSWVEERTEITALVGAFATVLLLVGGVLSLRWFQQFP
jgi:Ca-activated chloride channel homolog